ncbi:GntR family transcriptional regulator [Lentilactobacillus parafarraginis]|jgi:DNA-binding transcriptional regulator YhcF (GntR family)|uniref:Transcriptional regulator, GntR family n=2 Tax=Lentilactobacillus parafarraginis TaxID=390842 RepID=A0A0R1YTV7_9LACO|nr:GntR family transcriptional regulator [Lentilactobacillus parafarraginis]KRM45729.1 transcriptional regulator, GntR family [Lentilactobacillus parafarraginis DSM 18390 = JCM 14109]TLQ20760.1 GntR family transcriptional regulator [Lentilactobacillus parafarraginis]
MQFDDKVPIYYQIKEYIYRQIITGKLAPGDKMPSVRQLAVDLTVNVNTIQRALSELTAENLIEPKRGKGNFVTATDQQISELKEQLINEHLQQLYKNLRELNVSDEEILNDLGRYIDKQRDDQK